MQVTIALPNDESDQDGIQEAQLYLPIGKIHPVDHAGAEGDDYSEKRDQ